MHKQFFRKSILLQGFVGFVLLLLLVIPALKGFSSHPVLSSVSIGLYLILVPALTMLIEARIK